MNILKERLFLNFKTTYGKYLVLMMWFYYYFIEVKITHSLFLDNHKIKLKDFSSKEVKTMVFNKGDSNLQEFENKKIELHY